MDTLTQAAPATQDSLLLWQVDLDDYVAAVDWSHNRTGLLALTSAGHLLRLAAATGQTEWAELAHPAGALCLAACPSAPVVATGGLDGRLVLRNADTGQVLHEQRLGTAWVEVVRWSPDGQYLAVTCGRALHLFDAAGHALGKYADHESTVSVLSWRADSQALATGCYSAARLFAVPTPEADLTAYETLSWKNSMISLAWNADGRYLAAGTQDARIHFWMLPHVPESDLEMSGYASKVKELSWDATGRWLASNCGPEIILWDASGAGPAGRQPVVLRAHLNRVQRLTYQHRGGLLASGDESGEVFLWQPARGRQPLASEVLGSPITTLRWSADDTRLAIGTASGRVAIL